MAAALTDQQLEQIRTRDTAAADGWTLPDYDCAEDRHLLLTEVDRLRNALAKVRSGRPIPE